MSLRIRRKIFRPDKTLIEAFRGIPTTIASDAMNRMRAMTSEIKPLHPSARMVGPAVTVQALPGDNLAIHHAIYAAEKGDVLVIDGRGSLEIAIFGFIQTEACRVAGLAGAVVDGVVRDSRQISESRFSVFAKGACAAGPHKGWGGDINLPVSCGGVSVNPGDIIIGDNDGVVVVPSALSRAVLEESFRLIKKEEGWLRAIEKGETTIDLLDLETKIEEI